MLLLRGRDRRRKRGENSTDIDNFDWEGNRVEKSRAVNSTIPVVNLMLSLFLTDARAVRNSIAI